MVKYSASEAAKKIGISKDSIRYYEKEGLLPPIERNYSGHRTFSDSDIDWLFFIRCLRETDMSICKIKKYVNLLIEQGGESIAERREILLEHEDFIREKIMVYQNMLQLIEKKLDFYNTALSSENPEAIRCMDYATEWKQFKSIIGGTKHD